MDRVVLAATYLLVAAGMLLLLLMVWMDRDGIVLRRLGSRVLTQMANRDRLSGLVFGSAIGGFAAWSMWSIGMPWMTLPVGGLVGMVVYRLIGRRAAYETIRQRHALNRSTTVFIDQILLYESYPPIEMVRVMASFPSRRVRDLRAICQMVLERVRRNEGLPFGLLDAVAAEVDAVWFRRLTSVMTQYEQHGTPFQEPLRYLRDEYMIDQDIAFRRRMQRAQFVVLGVSALSVMSIAVHILYVMVAGSDLSILGLW